MLESGRVEIGELYEEIHAWVRQFDREAVSRQIIPRALESEVVLIAQAPGASTQRLSGIPYVTPSGELRQTGRLLDQFLRRFGYTVDPRDDGRRYAYCTDTAYRYPGRGKGGDLPPAPQEIAQCAKWLDRELTLIAPRVIVLLGTIATENFFKWYLNRRVQKLADVGGRGFDFNYRGRSITAYAVYHPASRVAREEVEEVYEDAAEEIAVILEEFRAQSHPIAKGSPEYGASEIGEGSKG